MLQMKQKNDEKRKQEVLPVNRQAKDTFLRQYMRQMNEEENWQLFCLGLRRRDYDSQCASCTVWE